VFSLVPTASTVAVERDNDVNLESWRTDLHAVRIRWERAHARVA